MNPFKALRRRGVEKIIGGTPRDWKLEPPGAYIELHVRPRSHAKAKPWREHEEQVAEGAGITDGIVEGTARSVAATVQRGGFRARGKNPAAEAAFAAGVRSKLIEHGKTRISREERRRELQRSLDLARLHLLLGAYWCVSPDPPVDLQPVMDAVAKAEEGAALDRAIRAQEEALSPANLLIRSSEPTERREITEEELDALLSAELPDLAEGEEATVLPNDWSPAFGRQTLSQALLRVIADLARYGAEGAAASREAEAEMVKKARTSGPSAALRPASASASRRSSTVASSPPGSAPDASENTGPTNAAAAARSKTTAAA